MNKNTGFTARYGHVNILLLLVFSLFLLYFILSVFSLNPFELSSVYSGIGITESTGLHRSIVLCLQMEPEAAAMANRSGLAVTLFFVVQWIIRLLLVIFRSRTSAKIMYADVILSGLMFLAAFRNFIILLF